MRNKVEPITLAATTTCILLHLACSSAGPAGAEEPIAISPTTPEIGEYDTIVRTPDWWPSVGPRIASIEDRGLELWIQKDLNRDLFYIAPRVSIIVSEMESALEKALAARQSPDAIVSVAVPVNLIDDAVRNKAAVALNAQGLKDSKGNGILPSSISLYPYTYLIVFWQMNGQRSSTRLQHSPALQIN